MTNTERAIQRRMDILLYAADLEIDPHARERKEARECAVCYYDPTKENRLIMTPPHQEGLCIVCGADIHLGEKQDE